MSMPLGFSIRVSLHSMRKRMIRTILSLIPAVLLISVMFVGATIPNGLVNELDNQVLKKIESHQELVTLDESMFMRPNSSSVGGSGGMPEMELNKDSFTKATSSPLIQKVYEQFGNVSGKIDTLGNMSQIDLGLKGVSAEYARMFSGDSFAYKRGKPIPIILNPYALMKFEPNFAGKPSVEIDYMNEKDVQEKSKYTELKNPENVIGQMFRVRFGTFPQYPVAIESPVGNDMSKRKITKLTDEDKKIIDKRVSEIYAPFWNVNLLKQPTEYTFKVIGLTGRESASMNSYVPTEATVDIFNALYQKQLSARTNKPLDKDFLSREQGLVKVRNGKILSDSTGFMGVASETWTKESNETTISDINMATVHVPSLLVTSTKRARGDVEYKEASKMNITNESFEATSAVVRLNSADDRDAYIKYLADNDIQYFDNSPLAMVKALRAGSKTFVTWMTIILGSIVSIILIATVTRFVADSRREIGVWRAIGATRFDIIKLIMTRTIVVLAIAIGIGVVVGLGISTWSAAEIAKQAHAATDGFNPYATQGFVGGIIISLLGGDMPNIQASNLVRPDWILLISRISILVGITLLIALIPALRASRISPVSAIRNSE